MLPELDYRRKELVSQVIPPHPAPEVSARDALPGEIGGGARQMIKAAEAAGWEARATYARGNAVDRHGHAGALISSLAVRMRHPGTGRRAVAVWTSPAVSEGPAKWTADVAYTWPPGGLATVIAVSALKMYLSRSND